MPSFKSLFGRKSSTSNNPDSSSNTTNNTNIMSGKATAKVNGVVVAEADNYETVEGNIYFPPSSLKREYFTETNLHTDCPWKGKASYYTLKVDGTELKDVAWYYPEPKSKATNIKDYVAFYKSKVEISAN